MNDVLETERVILRAFNLDDVEAMYLLGSVPEVVRYTGNKPYSSIENARAYLIANPLQDYEIYGYGRFACVLKETGNVIGFCGIKYLPEIEENELGYRFLPSYWGMGLAKETARAVIDYARNRLHLSRLVSVIHPKNDASKNVVVPLYFKYEKDVILSFVEDSHLELYSAAL